MVVCVVVFKSILVVDVNEVWDEICFEQNMVVCVVVGVVLIEQLLLVGDDYLLIEIESKVMICVDESLYICDGFEDLCV